MELLEEQRRKAIETLAELGIVKYVKDLDLYHGRAGDGTEWQVVPNYHNAGNATGNSNVAKIDGLYASSKQIATEFAVARSLEKGGQSEVHKIVSYDKRALVFDLTIDPEKFSENDRHAYRQALKVLGNLAVTNAMPVKYEYKDALVFLQNLMPKYKNANELVDDDGVNGVIAELKQDDRVKRIFRCQLSELSKFVNDFCGAWNTHRVVNYFPKQILNAYFDGYKTVLCAEKNIPISHEYVSAWCATNHVVGVKLNVNSATLDKTIEACHMFDTKKIMSEKQKGMMLASVVGEYGDITQVLGNIFSGNQTVEKLFGLGNAREIMDYLMQDTNCAQLYQKSAHLWEGWTVGQHTQAVVDFFDKYYKEDVLGQLRPFVKTCLVVHDIGKGHLLECDKGNKSKENFLNLQYAPVVYDYLHITPAHRKVIDFIISESQNFTSKILLGQGDKTTLMAQMQMACRNAFVTAFQREPSLVELDGLQRICVILQECDSGAYTRYASIHEDNMTVSGANDRFTESFVLNERGEPRLKCFLDEPMKSVPTEKSNTL